MPVSQVCESCESKLKVSEKHIGKKIRCPKCGNVIQVTDPTDSFQESEDDEFGFDDPPPLPPVSRSLRPQPKPVEAEPPVLMPPRAFNWRKRPSKNWLVPTGVGFVCLVVGYFAGREHLKYEFRSALQRAGQAISTGMQNAFTPRPFDQAAGTVANGSKERPAKLVDTVPPANATEVVRPAVPGEVVPPPVAYGQAYRSESFELAVTGAAVGPVPLKDRIRSTTGESANPLLVIKFHVKNVHDRKILRFLGDATFSQKFQLFDDVDNRIRGVSFGFSDEVIGALQSSDDIQPEQSATHVEVFSVPPEKTKELLLSVDLQAFAGEGLVRFSIPAERIAGFRQ